MDTHLIVFYEEKVLITIDVGKICWSSKSQILDWYADKYAFEREKLSGVWSKQIKFEPVQH